MSNDFPSDEIRRLLKQGQDYFFQARPDFSKATEIFLQVVKAAPEWGEGYEWLASVYLQRGKLEEAQEAELSAIKLMPDDPRTHISMGVILQKAGRHDEAVSYFEKGISLKPHYAEADARLMLAESYLAIGRREDALPLLKYITTMQPFYPSHERPMEEAKKLLAKYN